MADEGGRRRRSPDAAPPDEADDDGAFATDEVDVEPGVPPPPLLDGGSPA